MNDNSKKAALITGATSGFGWEFCRLFAKDGYQVVMVARHDRDLLEYGQKLRNEFPDAAVEHVALDLAKDGAPNVLYDQVIGKGITVHFLINNAGFGDHGLFVENRMEKEMQMVYLNVVALTQLTKLYLRDMVKRDEGRILQVSSALGIIPAPKFAVYSATKAYVHFLTASVQEEIKDTNVTMTALYPGASDTEFFDRADGEDTVIYQDTPLYDAREVATAGYDGLMNGENRVIPGVMNKMQIYSSKILPDMLLRKGMGLLMEEKD